MYKLEWRNETGSGELGVYPSVEECKNAALVAYVTNDIDETDITQAWAIDEDGEEIEMSAAGEWSFDAEKKIVVG